MYLVDTNLIAEILLQQAKAEEVKRFLESTTKETGEGRNLGYY